MPELVTISLVHLSLKRYSPDMRATLRLRYSSGGPYRLKETMGSAICIWGEEGVSGDRFWKGWRKSSLRLMGWGGSQATRRQV